MPTYQQNLGNVSKCGLIEVKIQFKADIVLLLNNLFDVINFWIQIMHHSVFQFVGNNNAAHTD
jgi:hypothetical protein